MKMKPNAAVLIAILVLVTLSLNSVFSALTGSVIIGNSGNITTWTALPLHIEGKYIKNSINQTIYLRGVNRPSGFTSSCTGSWFRDGDWAYGYSYTHWDETGLRQRLAQMKALGFNVIRCIMFIEWWVKNSTTNLDNQTTDKGFQFCFSETVRIAQEYGIYIIIAPWGSDAPDQSEMPFPTTTIPNQQAFIDFWLDVSSKLKQYPNVIYELFNEPAGSVNTWLNACNATITALRNADDQHIVIVQYGYCGGFVEGSLDWVDDPRIQGLNILYSNHIYRYPSGNTMPATTSYDDYNEISNCLLNTWRYDLVVGKKPIIIGEIGASVAVSNTTSETQYWTNALNLLNNWNMSYAAWNWDQPGSGWDLQTDLGQGPYPPNQRGQILVNAIANWDLHLQTAVAFYPTFDKTPKPSNSFECIV